MLNFVDVFTNRSDKIRKTRGHEMEREMKSERRKREQEREGMEKKD